MRLRHFHDSLNIVGIRASDCEFFSANSFSANFHLHLWSESK